MPTSNLALAPVILHLAHEIRPRCVLDVGPGRGKYGLLLREYVAGIERVDAVEVWPPYITPRLLAIYDEVIRRDVRDLEPDVFDRYDLVLMIDVLEHLHHYDGEKLLDRISSAVIVCTPSTYFQNPEHEDIPPEAHRSLWATSDFGSRIEADQSALGGVVVRLAPIL